MKKILLLSFGCFATVVTMAQRANQTSIVFQGKPTQFVDNKTVPEELTFKNGIQKRATAPKKKTRANSRWYSYVNAIDTLNGGAGAVLNNFSILRMWQDSTVQQVFSTGPGQINYSSYYNILDPQAPVFNDVNLYPGEMQVGPTNTYNVDSAVIWGAYFRPKGGNPDTLIISVVKNSATTSSNDILFYNPNKTNFPEMLANGYVSGVGGDTIMSMPTVEGNVLTATAVNKNSTFIIKRVLTDADTSSFLTPFTIAIPNLAGEADRLVGLSVTFKSGNPWVANVDTVTKLNNFVGIFSEENDGAAQVFRGNTPDFDLNMSGLMFSTSRDSYYPSFFIEGWNSVTMDKEIAWIEYHVTCTNCSTVGINDVENNTIISSVSPNPATSDVTFALNLKESAKNVTIEISNALGQVVKTTKLGSIAANVATRNTISVADLSVGMYIYTINADGQKTSNKLMVK